MDFLARTITLTGYEVAAIISAVLIFASTFRYMHSIVTGNSKPNVVGWIIYQIATVCVLLSSIELSAMSTVVASLSYAISQLIIICLAVAYGHTKIHKEEKTYFMISLISLGFWIVFTYFDGMAEMIGLSVLSVSLIVLMINTFIDCMGALSIFNKLYKHPETEDAISWFLAFLAGVFSILAIEHFTFSEVLYPAYLVLSNLAIWLLCFREKPRHRFEYIIKILERFTGTSWRE